ncbi:MAG: hypothetical protein QOG68_286, partial [Solirubrobacteraceae bacterium]|nr:hypothetical protein [Solirubrobacteraceae bacterium]
MSALLRDGLLEGTLVAVAGEAPEVLAACAALGAQTQVVQADLSDEDAVTGAVAALGTQAVLVCATGELDSAFIATRATAAAWIAAGHGGRVVLIAARDDAPQRAALENLARTLSIEW